MFSIIFNKKSFLKKKFSLTGAVIGLIGVTVGFGKDEDEAAAGKIPARLSTPDSRPADDPFSATA